MTMIEDVIRISMREEHGNYKTIISDQTMNCLLFTE